MIKRTNQINVYLSSHLVVKRWKYLFDLCKPSPLVDSGTRKKSFLLSKTPVEAAKFICWKVTCKYILFICFPSIFIYLDCSVFTFLKWIFEIYEIKSHILLWIVLPVNYFFFFIFYYYNNFNVEPVQTGRIELWVTSSTLQNVVLRWWW